MSLAAGITPTEDTKDVASYSYDAGNKELISYDTPNIVGLKADYVKKTGLAGTMFWEVDALPVRLNVC